MGVASWLAAGMRHPTGDRRSLSMTTATSMALQEFASSKAMSAMRAARRDSFWATSPRGPTVGSSGFSSDVSGSYEKPGTAMCIKCEV